MLMTDYYELAGPRFGQPDNLTTGQPGNRAND